MRRISDYKRQFMKLYDEGLSDGNIAKTLGFAKRTVCYYRRRMNLPANFQFGHDRIVFSEEQKEKIREMRSRGVSIAEISREFDVEIQTMLKGVGRCRLSGSG
jgi:orotate phosphoribosyltransferase-like protein